MYGIDDRVVGIEYLDLPALAQHKPAWVGDRLKEKLGRAAEGNTGECFCNGDACNGTWSRRRNAGLVIGARAQTEHVGIVVLNSTHRGAVGNRRTAGIGKRDRQRLVRFAVGVASDDDRDDCGSIAG